MERKTKFCPKCKSRDVNIKIGTSAAYGCPQKWQCNNCGFELLSFPEKVVNIKDKK